MLKYNVGDKMIIINDTSFHRFEKGTEVTIVEKFHDGTDDEHYKVKTEGVWKYVEDHELAPSFEVGDKAIFTKQYNNLDSDSVVTVEKIDFEYMPHIPYRVADKRGYGGWVKAEDLKPIQKEEVPMRTFKAGDKVEIISNAFTGSVNEQVGKHYFDIGTIGVIDYKIGDCGFDGYFSVFSHGERWTVHAGDMTFADEVKEEAKEHKFLDKPKSGKMDGWMVVELTDMKINFNLTKEQAEDFVYKHIASGIDTENILVFAPNSNTRFEKSIKFFE